MKISIVTLGLAFAFTAPLYGAEDLKPDTSPEGAFPKKLHGSGVDNFYQLSDSLYSGSKPNGEESFRFLSKLGVKTILSVDGVAPEVALAKKYGIGYVHVPIGYDAINEAQASQIVKVAEEQPGPLFIHCHYGMNRGPSAAAIVCIAKNGWTPEQATAWMKRAGTSANCAGLFRDVRNFKAPSSVTATRTTGAKLAFDTYSGYFVSNKFEPKALESFVVISDQEQFDKVFGVAFVMRDKSHRLPKDAFKSLMVVAAIKRGSAVVEYKVEGVTDKACHRRWSTSCGECLIWSWVTCWWPALAGSSCGRRGTRLSWGSGFWSWHSCWPTDLEGFTGAISDLLTPTRTREPPSPSSQRDTPAPLDRGMAGE